MRRISLALALVGAVAVTGCSGGNKPAANTDSGVQKGVTDQYYFVNLFSKPVGGVVTSDIGGINCGAQSQTPNGSVYSYSYYNIGGVETSVCGQTQFQWVQTVTLHAAPQGSNVFIGWAGDCSGKNDCVLSAGADKTVVAIFGTAGGGHTNFTDPAIHGPAYGQYLSATPGALLCTTCHGPTLEGQSIAPSCGTCHPNPGPRGTPPAVSPYTRLVAAITSVTPATKAVTFTLKNNAGANVDVTGATSANWPMPVTLSVMNFGTDANGNALPLKSATGGNPATVSPYAAISSMSITTGTVPSTAPANTYPSGSATQGAVTCTTATPCTCSAAAPCTYLGNAGFGYHTATKTYGACTAAAPCVCAANAPCGPALPYSTTSGTLSYAAGVYTFTFVTSPIATAAPYSTNTHVAFLATYRREDLTVNNNTPSASVAYVGEQNGAAYKAVNVPFYFNPASGAASTVKRDIVSDAACAKCHDGFQQKAGVTDTLGGAFHSGARIGAEYCNVCHYEGRGTNGFADSATFVHRIHAGKDLTKVTSGTATSGYKAANPYTGGSPTSCSATVPCTCTVLQPCSIYTFHGIAATYPQAIANCAECHDATTASSAGQFASRPTIAACGSCHDQLVATFLPVGTASVANHPVAGQTQTNATCATCHTAANIASVHTPVVPPAADNCFSLNNASGCNNNTNAGYIAAAGVTPAGIPVVRWTISDVSTWTDTSVSPNVLRPQATFAITVGGTPVDFGTYAAGTKDELINGFVGAPSVYFVWGVPQDGITAPADFNASASIWLKSCWRSATNCNLSRNATTGAYTLQVKNAIVPANATMLTGGVGYSYGLQSTQPLTEVDVNSVFPANDVNVTAGTVNFGTATATTCTLAAPCVVKVGGLVVNAPNVSMVAPGVTGRRAIVSNAKCNACHASLGVEPTFHAGQRNDGPSCSWCHNPNRTSSSWSANSPEFIHGIHGGEARTVGFNWHAACLNGATWNATTLQCERAGVAEGPSIFYPEIEYPGKLSDCTQCHEGQSYAFAGVDASKLLWVTVTTGTPAAGMSTSPYATVGTNYGSGFGYAAATGITTAAAATTLVSSPIAAACFSCHDSASARLHIENEGGWIYKARGAGFSATANAETCLSCHGAGMFMDITAVHK
jgi:OmcA/MtrC family decaheme c-type cytochrome